MPPKGATRARRQGAAPAAALATVKATKPRGRPAATKATKAAKATKATKATATKAKAPKKPLQEAKANTGVKRKREAEPEEKPVNKRQKRGAEARVAPPPAAKKPKKEKIVLNHAPTTRLEVFVFGSNSNGELGLGDTFKKAECPRPKLNFILADAGVVQISTGGMHCVALTHDNKILTWGVNDQGALGRDTQWEGKLVDIDKANEEDSDEEDDEIEVNPREATPTEIDMSGVEPGTVFTQVAAADSASFALTDEGKVYGWGTFRGSNGVFGFSPEVEVQRRPALIPELENVTKIVAGSNHVIALLSDGTVHTWGSGEQDQLARRVVERRKKLHALLPQRVGLRRGIVDIATGPDHAFAIHQNGTVYSWGLNNYGQTGIPSKAGESEATILKPAPVPSLKGRGKIVRIEGGNFNSIAVTEHGECLVWGRIDNKAIGIDAKDLPEDDVIFDERGKPRILTVATRIPTFEAATAAFGTEHAIAITKDGKAYSWGFNSSYQTGQPTDDDISVATLMDSKSIREKKLIWAGAGGQYGMVASQRAEPAVNGEAAAESAQSESAKQESAQQESAEKEPAAPEASS